jgi:hypothetical protein
VGLASGSATLEIIDEMPTREDEAGPFLEGYAGIDVALGRHLSLSFAAVGRGHLTGEEDRDQGEPDPLPRASLTIQAGLAWDFGGQR